MDLLKAARAIASSQSGGRTRTAGKIEFVKDTGPVRRDIRVKGFQWTPESLRTLAKILWAAQRSHSYAISALRLLSKMPSSDFSPDGLLGGRGYIQSVKDMRAGLGQAVEVLSSFTDTVHDEVNASHWAASEDPTSQGIVEDAEQVRANPENFVENEFEGEGAFDSFENPAAEDMNPQVENPESAHGAWDGEEDDEEAEDVFGAGRSQVSAGARPGALKELARDEKKDGKKKEPMSRLPGDGTYQGEAKTAPEMIMNTTTPAHGNYASAFLRAVRSPDLRTAALRVADSSVPVETLPGPRVDHIGPAAGNEAGHFNNDEVWPSDDPLGEGFSHLNPIYEDGNQDGVTGDDNPTDGDETVLKLSAILIARTANYSWLPGSRNEKNLDYYALGLSAEEVEWMKAHSEPDPPKGLGPKKKKFDADWLWDPDLR